MSRLTGSYIESKIGSNIDLIGGSGYIGGASYSAPGALTSSNISTLTKIGNGLKSEPYSLHAIQFRWSKLAIGVVPASLDRTFFMLPDTFLSPTSATEIVSANFAYTALTAGTSMTGAVMLVAYDRSRMIDHTITNLAPVSLSNATVLIGTLAGNVTLQAVLGVTSIAGGSGSDCVLDAVLTLICKSKHVA